MPHNSFIYIFNLISIIFSKHLHFYGKYVLAYYNLTVAKCTRKLMV